MSDFTLDVGLAYKIKQALVRNKISDLTDLDWLATGDNIVKVRQLRLSSVLLKMFRTDRAYPVTYPDGMEPLYPQLEAEVPTGEFILTSLAQWTHDGQVTGHVTGHFLHEYLRDHQMLNDCLGLAELLEIQKLGIDVFRRHFADKEVYGWRSVVRDRGGNLRVPFLFEKNTGEVGLGWGWLNNRYWGAREPALRFGW